MGARSLGSNNRKASRDSKRRELTNNAQTPYVRNPLRDTDYYRPVKPITFAQQLLMESIHENILTFAEGAAGTGKTKIAVGYASELLRNGDIDKIYLIRPAVTADEDLGFLPGEIEDKYEPYFRPFREHFNASFKPSFVDTLKKSGVLEALPIGFCRGNTFGGADERAVVIVDEAQNTTPAQMKMLLTRIGFNAKVIITGDTSQSDLKGLKLSGLSDAINRVSGMKKVGHIKFTYSDCVRSDFCKEVLRRYDA